MRLRIVPGSVTGGELRALVLTCHAAPGIQPAIELAPSSPGATVALTRASGGVTTDALLAERGVRAWVVEARGLRADTSHSITVRAGGQQKTLHMRTLPSELPRDGLTVAVASCCYHGFPLQERLRVALESRILVERPRLALLVGDNVYLDVGEDARPPRGLAREVVARYLDYFLDDRYLDARGTLPVWTTWDDHELWNDYPEGQRHLGFTGDAARRGPFEQCALGCLDLFQASLNPSANAGGRSFVAGVDPVSFFVADTRTERTPIEDPDPQLMPPAALDHLCSWAAALEGPGVLVLGQPLWIRARNSALLGLVTADHNPPAFARQYRRIVDALREAPFDVLVVSGDVHYSRLLRIAVSRSSDNRFVYELVSSPAVHIPTAASTVGLDRSQGRASIDDPSRVPEWPGARAEYLFGTDIANTYALLHFAPAAGSVRVSVAFEDITTNGIARVVERTDLGRRKPGWGERRAGSTFNLRER